MATIRNAIAMQDRMTPVFNKMIKSMTSTLKTMESIDRAANRGVTSRAFDRASSDIRSASNEVVRLQNNLRNAEQPARGISNAFKGIGLNALGVNSVIQLAKSLADAVKRSTDFLDNITNTTARLNLINDGLQTTSELQDKILRSANNARMSYGAMADNVAKLNMLAGASFSSNDEAIAFVETLNKMFVISGAGAQEAQSAMYQLTQAMAAGKLQGDEFRSIMENAPMLADAIAKFVGISKGELKELSSEGLITSDIIKNAMFSATDEVNEKFNRMPKTFAQSMQVVKNTAIAYMQPVADKFNQWLNSEKAAKFFTFLSNSIGVLSNIAIIGIGLITEGIDFLIGVLEILKPALAVAGAILVAWAITQIPLAITAIGIFALNVWAAVVAAWNWVVALLAANWPILLIALAIALLIFILGKLGVTFDMIVGFIVGLLYSLLAVAYNLVAGIINGFSVLANFLGNLFIDPIGAIKMLFLDMAQYIVDKVMRVAKALQDLVNMIPGVEVNFTTGLENIKNMILETKAKVQAESGVESAKQLEYKDISSAYKSGYSTGSNFVNNFGKGDFLSKFSQGGFDSSKFSGNNFDGNLNGGKLDEVGKTNSDVKITDEDIKLLKDVASTEFINKFTTLRPEMKVEFTGPINETADVNKILAAIEDMAEDALASVIIEEAS